MNTLIFNRLDKIFFFCICTFVVFLYLIWLIGNIVQTNDTFIWFLSMPVALCLSFFLSKEYSFSLEKTSRKEIVSLGIFLVLTIGVFLYYLEPLFRFPHATIGIPFKDMHDGIAVFMADYGFPSITSKDPSQTSFILNQQRYYQNIYQGYPNVMHSLAAFLIKFGVFEFHASWVACSMTISLNACAFFLFLKSLYRGKNAYIPAFGAGLFGISTYRLPYTIISSIVMFFGYSLIVPTLLIIFVSIRHYKNPKSLILPFMALSLVGGAFSGAVFVTLGLLALYLALLLFYKNIADAIRLTMVIMSFLVSIPLLIALLTVRGAIYHVAHPYAENVDYDPNELSQHISLFDTSVYMIVYFASLGASFYYLFRNKLFTSSHMFKNYLLLVNLGLLSLNLYDIVFQMVTHIATPEGLLALQPEGLFGGLNHFITHRLALLQPYFFVFLLFEVFYLIKKETIAAGLIAVFIFSNTIMKFTPTVEVIEPALLKGFYNTSDKDAPYTFLSQWRLITSEELWPNGLFEQLSSLKTTMNSYDRVLIWDSRGWPEESLTHWGAIYLRKKIYTPTDVRVSGYNVDSASLDTLVQSNIQYLIFIYPSGEAMSLLQKSSALSLVYANTSIVVYRRN